jgi:hypothetical protein
VLGTENKAIEGELAHLYRCYQINQRNGMKNGRYVNINHIVESQNLHG